jgi:two-component system, cell cycle response regulator DivK
MNTHILIIEDNEQNLYLATYLLKHHGFTVSAAHSGPEGIEMAAKIQPGLIILDIQLPQMDGYAVARELRNNPALKHVPIVAVTSYAMVGDRERTLAAGCNGYIEKPINPDTFTAEIEHYLSNRPQTGGKSA